jgi:hypothetical protein
MSKIYWHPIDPLEIIANYTVPYTADVDVEYRLAKNFGVYADAGNFFQGFVVGREGDITNRQFYQMSRVEAGVRLIFGKLIDCGVGIGYAFNQDVATGFDVRGLSSIGQISNEPYLGFILRGRF